MSASSTAVAAESVAAPAGWDRRPQVEALLADIFRLMEYPVRLDFKDLSDGSLGVAVHVDGEQPGITPGKKSFLVDSVQFLVNKAINRPNLPRRWINLGVNGFPEPRAPQQQSQPQQSQPPPAPKTTAPPAPQASAPNAGKGVKDAKHRDERRPQPSSSREPDEATMQVTADAAWTAVAKALAEKSAKLGRPYGVMLMNAEDRARLVQAAAGVKGVTVKAEGEGHWRRVAFKPDKLTPMPKKAVMPDYDDDEDE